MKKMMIIAQRIEDGKRQMFDAGLDYDECNDMAKAIFESMTDKLGNVLDMTSREMSEAILFLDNEFNLLTA